MRPGVAIGNALAVDLRRFDDQGLQVNAAAAAAISQPSR
jgi:hypothetical protein